MVKKKNPLFILGIILLVLFLLNSGQKESVKDSIVIIEDTNCVKNNLETKSEVAIFLKMGQAECDTSEYVCGLAGLNYNQYYKNCQDIGSGQCSCTKVTCASTGYCVDGIGCGYCKDNDNTCGTNNGDEGYNHDCWYDIDIEKCKCYFHVCDYGCEDGECIAENGNGEEEPFDGEEEPFDYMILLYIFGGLMAFALIMKTMGGKK